MPFSSQNVTIILKKLSLLHEIEIFLTLSQLLVYSKNE